MKQYLGLWYEVSKDGKEYAIYDKTAVFGLKYKIACGASNTDGWYTERYVKKEVERIRMEGVEE